MPLLKRKPYHLAEMPRDLKPDELVFQVRFTKEIFRDYEEYLNRINLYRQRVWTCKVTGKTNLTYEEALVSERRAIEKAQQFPRELVHPALQMIQFSTLRLKDLISKISTRLVGYLLEGEEVYFRKGESVLPCKILKVLGKPEDDGDVQYEVGWLDKDKKIVGSSIESPCNLARRKPPFSRQMLKSFIRESTSQGSPWIVHERLTQKYRLLTEMPEELRGKIKAQKGQCHKNISGSKGILAGNGEEGRKRRIKTGNNADMLQVEQEKAISGESKPSVKNGNIGTKKRKTSNGIAKVVTKEEEVSEDEKLGSSALGVQSKVGVIKYPIEDLIVQACVSDPDFMERPAPSTDFIVPMDSLGNLLMVWDFCASFSRMLNLWPFSLEDFENAIIHKGSNVNLIIEAHAAIFRLLIKDKGDYYTFIQKKRRKPKITLVNWTEYLCDFLEMEDVPEFSGHISTIRRGHYGLLDCHAKLDIFQALVNHALTTEIVREQLEDYIEQRQVLAATNREAAVEESRKRRQQKQMLKENGSEANDGEGNLDGSQISRRPIQDVHPEGKGISSNGYRHLQNGEARRIASARGSAGKKVNGALNLEIQKRPTATDDGNEEKKINKGMGLEDKKQRQEHFEREIEKCFIRTNPLGKDRNHSRYWFFRREGRVFIESSDFKQWGYYSGKEEIDLFMEFLNPKGEREWALHRQLQKHYGRICNALQKRSREIAQRLALDEAELRRSVRVRSKVKESSGPVFLRYVNKWKEA